ncbi:SAC3 domain-containing protein 1 isoform X1 [Periplaneta americana]|uniref:SAC3 domain-containing protein 1 isoform X1 n=1 Tax=Periplaneta americana TaxID=6978 RepID=UPI0037E933C3
MSEHSDFIRGTCTDMCPARERRLREREGLLHILELPEGCRLHPPPKANPQLTVKSFSRSAAGQLAPRRDELRPPAVLQKTVHYLLKDVAQRQEVDWCVVYDFVFDRLRAVRQDLVIQGLNPKHGIMILEPIVRFHCYAGYRLCSQPASKFDATINHTHLLECLTRLLVLYDEVQQCCHVSEERREMEALYLLVALGDGQALTRALQLPTKLRRRGVVHTALVMSLAMWNGNYARVCALIPQLPPLLMCAAALQLPNIRRRALQVMSHAYSCRNLTFPLDALQSLLLYRSCKETASDCQRHGFTVEGSSVVFSRAAFRADVRGACQQLDCVDTALESCSLPSLLLHSKQ